MDWVVSFDSTGDSFGSLDLFANRWLKTVVTIHDSFNMTHIVFVFLVIVIGDSNLLENQASF